MEPIFILFYWECVEYTNLNNLSLCLRIKGEIRVKVYHVIGITNPDVYSDNLGKYTEEEFIKLLNEKYYSTEKAGHSLVKQDNNYIIKFKKLYKNGTLNVGLKAISDLVLLGGYYSTKVNDSLLSPVRLAICICNYKREEAVTRNLTHIFEDIINNPVTPLKDKLEVYVADNGQTLDIRQLCNDKVHVLPNLNLGGVGGFTRTMIEALEYDKEKSFTHIILMDDDILLYPAVFERTFYLLQFLRESYKKAILGSSMFF